MGDVIGDLNKRRGQVEGMESTKSGARIVKAMVPLAEMFGYVTALRTITSGRATSSMTYDHHSQVIVTNDNLNLPMGGVNIFLLNAA